MNEKERLIKFPANPNKFRISSNGLNFDILSSGDIDSINYEYWTINMYRATSLDGMMANLYLRITKDKETFYTKLLGIDSPSNFKISKNQMLYTGFFMEVNYKVHFKVKDYTWFWDVELESDNKDLEVELFYGQDISLGSPHANQAYVCQYIDHFPYEENNAYHVLTKQNEGMPLMIQQGSLTENECYATDGFDFFGKAYKYNNKIQALVNGSLPSRNYQYELAHTSFKTRKQKLNGKYQTIFYASFTNNHDAVNQRKVPVNELFEIYKSIEDDNLDDYEVLPKIKLKINYQNTLEFKKFTNEEIEKYFPDRILEEKKNDEVLSWFSEYSTHYVNGVKEQYLERPEGNIIMNNGMNKIDKPILASTNYIFGLFNSHIILGNTQFNRLLTINKTPLNILKTSGMRLFVKNNGEYKLLTMPGVYAMYVNTSSWYYKLEDDILIIEVAIAAEENKILMNVSSMMNNEYEFLLTSEIVLNDVEHVHPIELIVEEDKIVCNFSKNSETYKNYPNYYFELVIKSESKYLICDDRVFFEDGISRENPILAVSFEKTSSFGFNIYGKTGNNTFKAEEIKVVNKEYYQSHLKNTRDFMLEIDKANENYKEIIKFNYLVTWYIHDALVHYASPHGLEQYGGGAWGTRDICQGPVELFTSFDRFDLVRSTILNVYSRQFEETGDWPQWFMFDKFDYIQADSSHGDVIVWPLYAISRYMIQTGDRSILNEVVPYTSLKSLKKVNPSTILNHIKKQIDKIEKSFIEGTYLSSYGGGDWDDTLQPANRDLTTYLSSSWTVSLTIQAIECFLVSYDDSKMKTLVNNMKQDYLKYFMIDNIPAGFIEIKDEVKPIVHPNDDLTGIKYRLISFNQGILAELFTKNQIEEYLTIIDKHLMHPDGVHLMDTTVKYQGGKPKIFIRAETATNFGREISLNYIHAHLRYIEAMSKIGNGDRLFMGLKIINPILIEENVPNALPRQANVYFSSSDGDFINRYDADNNYYKLKTGEVKVKSGWRLYSSGPGIYLNQLVNNFLGVNSYLGDLYLDPVLPKTLDGLKFKFTYMDMILNITYEVKKGEGVEYIIVNNRRIDRNTAITEYRLSGVVVPSSFLAKENIIVIRM